MKYRKWLLALLICLSNFCYSSSRWDEINTFLNSGQSAYFSNLTVGNKVTFLGTGDVQIGYDDSESDLYFPADHADIKGDGSTIIDFGVSGDEFGLDVSGVTYKFSTLTGDGDISVVPAGDDLVLGDGSGGYFFNINGANANFKAIQFQTGALNRWIVRSNSTSESGSNVGSDFEIYARADNGGALYVPFFIKRSNAYFGLGLRSWAIYAPSVPVHIGMDDGTMPGSISANTAFLISNNSATNDACNMSLIAGTATTAEIQFGDSGDENAGILGYNNNTDTLYARAGGSGTGMSLSATGLLNALGGFSDNGSAGIDTTFLDNDGNTITVSGGIVTAKTAP